MPLLGIRTELQQQQLGTGIPGSLEKASDIFRCGVSLQRRIDHLRGSLLGRRRFCFPRFGFHHTLYHTLRARLVSLRCRGKVSTNCSQVSGLVIKPLSGIVHRFGDLLLENGADSVQACLPADSPGLYAIQQLVQGVGARLQKSRISDGERCCQRFQAANLGCDTAFQR